MSGNEWAQVQRGNIVEKIAAYFKPSQIIFSPLVPASQIIVMASNVYGPGQPRTAALHPQYRQLVIDAVTEGRLPDIQVAL